MHMISQYFPERPPKSLGEAAACRVVSYRVEERSIKNSIWLGHAVLQQHLQPAAESGRNRAKRSEPAGRSERSPLCVRAPFTGDAITVIRPLHATPTDYFDLIHQNLKINYRRTLLLYCTIYTILYIYCIWTFEIIRRTITVLISTLNCSPRLVIVLVLKPHGLHKILLQKLPMTNSSIKLNWNLWKKNKMLWFR